MPTEVDPARQIHEEFPSVSPRPRVMSTPESNFLHQRDPSLHQSGPVKLAAGHARYEGHRMPNEPGAKINAYLGSLAGHSLIAEVPEDDPIRASRLLARRKKQIEVRLIKPEDISEGYFENQIRMAREQGHGDIQIDDELRREYIKVLQTDQRESLRDWVDYLSDKESNYPTWFKYYVLNGVTRLSDYDKDKGEFPRRSRSTTDPFPGLNREALAYVYDKLEDHLQGKKPDDAELAQLVKGGNFAKLYTRSLAEIGFADPELLKEQRGSWAKYDQSDNPADIRRLSDSLKGYGTGWCTAGEGYARTQLAAGDFYVFYSRDKDGVDRVPRVAIRMENGQVAEVRGIVGGSADMGPAENNRQELEPEMIDIAMAKLRELPGGEAYKQKADDMRRLTILERRLKQDPHAELSHDELSFLYELDHEIQGFGYRKDPRIAEIREVRGKLDYPQLRELLVGSLSEQVGTSVQGANAIVEQLNQMRHRWQRVESVNRSEAEAALRSKLAEWSADGSLDWCLEQMVENGGRVSLLATPNTTANAEEIIALANKFGEGQPYETYVYEDIYRRYSPEELSGPLAKNSSVRLSLVPGGYDQKLYGTVEEQRRMFREQQARAGSLKVPSVLDAVTLWQRLRARGDKLDHSSAFDRTYIRHFDLPEKRLDVWLRVPYSCVNNAGKPYLYNSYAERDYHARLAVG